MRGVDDKVQRHEHTNASVSGAYTVIYIHFFTWAHFNIDTYLLTYLLTYLHSVVVVSGVKTSVLGMSAKSEV